MMPGDLEERLRRLEVKVGLHYDQQGAINLTVAERIRELFRMANKTTGAMLAMMGTLILIGSAVGSVVLRAVTG